MKGIVHRPTREGMPKLLILSPFRQDDGTLKGARMTRVPSTDENRKNHLVQHWNFRMLDR